MEFLHPLMLYGTFLAGVPLIIHLLFRRKYQTVSWAAMEFLLQAMKQTKRRLTLENLLLLLLRMLILALLALALSRPILQNANLPRLGGEVKENLILVFDTSYSMKYSDQARTPFENAKEKALALLKTLKNNQDTLTLITLHGKKQSAVKEDTGSSVVLEFSYNLEEARRELEDLECSQHSGTIFDALPALKKLVENKEYPNKKIYILSDLQKFAWDSQKNDEQGDVLEGEFRTLSEKAPITIFDVTSYDIAENIAVLELNTPEKLVGTNTSIRFMARIRNFGTKNYGENERVSIDFFVDGEKQGSDSIELRPFQTKEIYFSHEFTTAGNHYVSIETQNDKLPLDNRRFFAFEVTESIPILVVDGEPSEKIYESETDTLMAALAPLPEGATNTFRPEKIVTRDIDFQDFSQYKIIILANVETLSEDVVQKLERFVQDGNNLLFFLGKKISVSDYNEYLYKNGIGLLPAKINHMKKDMDRKEMTYIVPKNYDHPMLSFFDKMPELLETTPVYRFFFTEWDRKNKDIQLVAPYRDGEEVPAILEKKFGRGKVVLFTTSCDLEWNDMAFSICYLPLMTETIEYLASSDERFQNIGVFQLLEKYFPRILKEEAWINLPDEEGTPSPSRVRLDLKQLGNENRMYTQFSNTEKIGIYQISLESEEKPIQTFAVNLRTEESNLERLSEVQLREKLGQNPKIHYLNLETTEKTNLTLTNKNAEYWRMLIYLILGCVLLETYLAQRFGNYSR